MDRRRKNGAIDRLVRYIPICITALLALACVLGARRYSLDSWEDLLNYTPPSLLGAAVLLLCGYALKSLSVVFPLSLLYVAAGVMLPLWMAWGVNLLGLLVCNLCCFFSPGQLFCFIRLVCPCRNKTKINLFLPAVPGCRRYPVQQIRTIYILHSLHPHFLPFLTNS